MSYAQVFLLKADISKLSDKSVAIQKGAVSDFSHKFVTAQVSRFTGISKDRIEYVQGEHGKPYIKGNPLYFNLSHCGNLILAAFCDEEIGADIELVRNFNSRIADRLFTPDEMDYMAASSDKDEKNRRFFEIWTAKEAFLKLCGTGISGGFGFSTVYNGSLHKKICSEKLGSAVAIHHSGIIKLDKNEVLLHNMTTLGECNAEYQVCICGRKICGLEFQFIQ